MLVRQVERRHKASFGAAGYKTGLVSIQVLHLLSKLQNWICPKTGQYKTCLESNTKIDCVYINIYIYIYVWRNIHIKRIYIKNINEENIYIHTQSILVFDSRQVLCWPVWDKSSFVASIEDAKPVLILNRFCNLLHPNRLCGCSKSVFLPTLNQTLQNRLCACSKTSFVPSLNLLHQNRLFAYPQPAAPKPALHRH